MTMITMILTLVWSVCMGSEHLCMQQLHCVVQSSQLLSGGPQLLGGQLVCVTYEPVELPQLLVETTEAPLVTISQ